MMTPNAANELLIQVAHTFGAKYAKTRMCHEPEVRGYTHMIYLRATFQPYNDANVNSLYIFLEGDKAKVQVAGQFIGEGVTVASEGFGHVSARATTDVTGMDAAALAAFVFELAGNMS